MNSNVERIPLNMNTAIKILIAISCLFLKKKKKINKLVIETNTIIKMLSVTKKSFTGSNIGFKLLSYVWIDNVKDPKIREINIVNRMGIKKYTLFLLATKRDPKISISIILMNPNLKYQRNIIKFSPVLIESRKTDRKHS